MNTTTFQELLREKGTELYRPMPWRDDTRPYYVLVSELMLQQTQVHRVIPKFNEFITHFPSEYELAAASLADVLSLWQGLGYNRRAKFLHESAKAVVALGSFPNTEAGLLSLPGVGKNTAGAIRVYAYNQPALFVETNIRTVYFHHFFVDGDKVNDKQIMDTLANTIDLEHPREFYWALMDYGTYLKKQGAGRLQQSAHYKKQGVLKGSVREVRGQIIKQLALHDLTREQLTKSINADERFTNAFDGLMRDGLIMVTDDIIHLTK